MCISNFGNHKNNKKKQRDTAKDHTQKLTDRQTDRQTDRLFSHIRHNVTFLILQNQYRGFFLFPIREKMCKGKFSFFTVSMSRACGQCGPVSHFIFYLWVIHLHSYRPFIKLCQSVKHSAIICVQACGECGNHWHPSGQLE